MYAKIIVALSISISIIDCYYLEAESNYLKPKLERNNIVNKGVWVRNKQEGGDFFDKNNIGNFIFRPNSLDVENGLQNNLDTFSSNVNILQDTPFVSSYVQRTRRSPDHIRKRRPRKSMKTGKFIKNSVEDAVMLKSKLVSDLKPTSVFNEYPYEVAILLNNEIDKAETKVRKQNDDNILNKMKLYNKQTNVTNHINFEKEDIKIISLNINVTNSTDTPKRSKKYDHVEDMTSFNMVEEYNNTETATDVNKQGRDIFADKDNRVWKQNSPIADNNFYKVVPKEPEKSKSVTERGLIKVITMLTKTFKKIMKQHSEIKNIHENLLSVNQNFDKKIAEMTSKFDDFDSKYADMIQFNNKLKSFEDELTSQKEYFDIKQKEIHNTFTDFQEQQKKFLIQQRQFYAIQKLMLAQNEKINAKQNLIAETQSQISHRQNNFARILKKAKQIINDNKARINQSYVKQQDKYTAKIEKEHTTNVPSTTTTTTSSPNTESMKINLFSIPTKTSKLENQDALIIREKDEKQIDDLVYKYYFNNTFIDALMKSKILNNYATNSESAELVNRSNQSKIKRGELETTIMLPVNNSLSDAPVKRERRWINHFSKNKYRKLNKHRKETTVLSSKETKKINTEITKINKLQALNGIKLPDSLKSDPFSTMATNFCNEIKQNTNEQTLKWCVEKALRRLKFMEMNAYTPPPVTVMVSNVPQATDTLQHDKNMVKGEGISNLKTVATESINKGVNDLHSSTTLEPVSKITPLYLVSTPTQAIFFPDNEELESNLKQYELKPDTEGNVYYDGSLHISDYGRLLTDSAATSDIMPGLMDSNSRMDIDPMTFDIQAKRRAYVRRVNENILHQMRGG